MKIPTTSTERINTMIEASECIYETIDAPFDGEVRARRLLRLGIHTVAHCLEESYGFRYAGDQWRQILGQVTDASIQHISAVQDDRLPTVHPSTYRYDPELDALASAYADVQRLTISKNGSRETNASHVIHLSALALPYAATYFPHLDQAKIALYCLIHDLPEAYAGDVPSLVMDRDIETKKQLDETAAVQRIEDEFSSRYPKLLNLLHDYETLSDEEAEFVKTFDKLDPGFTHLYSSGIQLKGALGLDPRSYHTANLAVEARMRRYSLAFPELIQDREELTRRVEQATWPETNIQTTL